MKSRFMILCLPAGVAAALFLFLSSQPAHEEFQLTPLPAGAGPTSAGQTEGTEVGTGYSLSNDPELAVREAVAAALLGAARKTPDFAILYATSGSDMRGILRSARSILGPGTRIFGGTSDSRGLMTNQGYVAVSSRSYEVGKGPTGVAVMTVSSQDITFGIGAGSLSDYVSSQELARAALLAALKDAGRTPEQAPKVVLLYVTIGIEEEILEGVEQVVGGNVPILGGTCGGPAMGVFGEGDVYEQGVCAAVIYTDLPLGWTFEAGFDVTEKHAGVATRVEGQAIVEIDGQPALDVYNEWIHGEIGRLRQQIGEPGIIRDLLTLHPLYRRYESPAGQDYFLFSHPWPKDDDMQDKSVMTSTKIKEGEEICLSSGTWETLLNRIGNLPTNAKVHGGARVNTRPTLALGFICAGVLGVIPERERPKMSFLLNYANSHGPFITGFTWGEQGHFPGIGNKHGNLSTSFLIIAAKGTSP